MLTAAMSWEERAVQILAVESKLEDFEDAIRTSEDIYLILPSLRTVKDAVSAAISWLESSKRFLQPCFTASALAFEDLREQVSQSRLLKISLVEQRTVETLMRKCEEWRCCACSSLRDVEEMMNRKGVFNMLTNIVILNIDQLRTKVDNVAAAGISLGFDFPELSSLQDACSTLSWCSRVLSFCSEIPSVESLVVSFSATIRQLRDAIEKHNSWQEKAQAFFGVDSSERSWSILLQLKELGEQVFNCPELDIVMSEFETVENWKQRGKELVGCSAGDVTTLSSSLLKIKQSLHRSLYIYGKSKCWKVRYFCTGCSSNTEDQEFIACSSCKDCYHRRCLVPKSFDISNAREYKCPYCALVDSGSISRSKDSPLKYKGKRPELEKLVDLSSDAKNFTIRLDEKDILLEIVDQALACRDCLSEIVDSSLSFFEKDVSSISRKLTIVLKALDVAGVYDSHASHRFDLALARNSWRIRASKLVEGSQKPEIQQVQRHLKEGSAINVPSQDYFKQKLVEVKQAGMQWAEMAKKVAGDKGNLELDKVFALITEGENLPVHFEKELKLLRDRSVLYCICRKPYDQRPMIACDQCDEWYHFDCVNLVSPPKIYICPACNPGVEGEALFFMSVKQDSHSNKSSVKDSEPQTPSPQHGKSRWKPRKPKSCTKQKTLTVANSSISLPLPSGLDRLLWRNRKPLRRLTKKRTELGNLTPLIHLER